MINKADLDKEISLVKHTKDKPPKLRLEVIYPLNSLSSENFELLIYSLYENNKNKSLSSINYESCSLIVGSGDKGRDVILLKNSKNVGVVQCKRYKEQLTKPQVAKEIIKFALHVIQNPQLAPDKNNFVYAIAASSGFNMAASELIDNFKTNIGKETDFNSWVTSVIADNVSIKIDPKQGAKDILTLFKVWKIAKIFPVNVSTMLELLPSIATIFFAMQQVVDKETFEEIARNRNININKFKEDYGSAVINNYSKINFFGLSLSKRPREIPLEELFVVPNIKVSSGLNEFIKKSEVTIIDGTIGFPFISQDIFNKLFSEGGLLYNRLLPERQTQIKLKQLLNSSKGIVILGKPGAGKTSIVKYTILKLLRQERAVYESSKAYDSFPIRVELYKYNTFKKKNTAGLIGYICQNLQEEFQISYISPGALEKILEDFNTIIFFDGLDEIFDGQERIGVRNDIENLDKKYELTLSIVTSRFESYKEVSLNTSRFNICEVKDFEPEQIVDYVNKWYIAEEENSTVREKEIAGCLADLATVDEELKTNPLLLSLILILYRNELELPTSKLEIYEGCTNTLIDIRDSKEKKLDFVVKIRNKAAIFSALAFWIFNKQISQAETILSFDDVRRFVKNYLIAKKEFDEDSLADSAALEFLEFAKLRSIFIEANFTHKTFLEYLTAYYIYTNYYHKGRIAEVEEIITNNINDASWSVVIELLFCKIDQEQPDYEIVDKLTNNILSLAKPAGLNILLQVVKHLKNISNTMLKEIIKQTVALCVKDIHADKLSDNKLLNHHLMDLVRFERFQSIITNVIKELAIEYKGNDIINLAQFHLENEISVPQYKKLSISFQNIDDIDDPYLYMLKFIPELTSIDAYYKCFSEFISKYGKKAVLKTYQSKYIGVIVNHESFNWSTMLLFSSKSNTDFIANLRQLKTFGIDLADINYIVKNQDIVVNLDEQLLVDMIHTTKNISLRKILQKVQYIKYGIDTSQQKVPYYKLFEKGKNKNW